MMITLPSKFDYTSFVVGEDDFKDIEIEKKESSGFWYFKNKKKTLIKNFILKNGKLTKKSCKVTLIKEGTGKFTPRFDFYIWNTTKKAYELFKKKSIDENFIKAKVDLGDCHENFLLLINFLKNFEDIEIDSSSLAVVSADSIIADSDARKILGQISNLKNKELIIKNLAEISQSDFDSLNAVIGVSKLKRVLRFWNLNKKNNNEEFWQNFFQENSWILSQIFCQPLVLFAGKGYVGGKNIENSGGKIADFIYQNRLTRNTAVIEIKTPLSKLIGSGYRSVYGMSTELTGSIAQVLDQKDHFQKNFYALLGESEEEFLSFSPKCIVLCGNLEIEALNPQQLKSFELFRNGSKDVEIITFDELFAKISMLLGILEPDADNSDVVDNASLEIEDSNFEKLSSVRQTTISDPAKKDEHSFQVPNYESEVDSADLPF